MSTANSKTVNMMKSNGNVDISTSMNGIKSVGTNKIASKEVQPIIKQLRNISLWA